MTDDPILELETRRRLFAFILDQPGAYLREIQRALDMPMGALEYHLGQLEKAGVITVLHEENKRFFPARMDAADKRGLSLLRQESLRRLVMQLLEHPGAAHKDILALTGLAASTLTFYMAKLVAAGLVERKREGRESHYWLVDPTHVYGLLVTHRPSFLDRVLDGFLDSFDGVHLSGSAPEDE